MRRKYGLGNFSVRDYVAENEGFIARTAEGFSIHPQLVKVINSPAKAVDFIRASNLSQPSVWPIRAGCCRGPTAQGRHPHKAPTAAVPRASAPRGARWDGG